MPLQYNASIYSKIIEVLLIFQLFHATQTLNRDTNN
jgi:hypothetical protein